MRRLPWRKPRFRFESYKRARQWAAGACWTALLLLLGLAAAPAGAQSLLEGEFGDIDLGRPLVERDRFPTIEQLREAVRQPQLSTVLMFKLHGDRNNHHLPVWSPDGQRLALQRSNLGVNASKLLLYQAMSEPEPTLLSQEPDSYDFMFRWAVNDASSFVFARIDPRNNRTRLLASRHGAAAELKTPRPGQYAYPALYQRTDGICRLAYEHDGHLTHEAWDEQQVIDSPLRLTRGTAPRWGRDGYHLLLLRERQQPGRVADYEVAVHNLRTEQELLLPATAGTTLRSPVWSPEETHVAYYAQQAGENVPWQIQVCRLAEPLSPKTLAGDVVVNPDFKSEGPSWEPSGQRIWYFAHSHRRQAYYPLVATNLETGQTVVVDYPQCCTSPNDLAVNPATPVPEIAFVGHDGVTRDLFVVFLNHY